MYVLALETSCDDTAAAVIALADAGPPRICSNVIWRQDSAHAPFGGVVPEVASREHLARLGDLVRQAVAPIGGLRRLQGLCASRGPGLVGSLLVGVQWIKGLALALQLPFLGVHHLEGHLCAALLTAQPPTYPHLALLASGGHTQLVAVYALGHYRLLAATRDDAAGEAFDKVAKLLGLGYPGGAAVEALAAAGNPHALQLPQALPHDDTAMSFSGLKAAVARYLQQHGPLTDAARADVAAAAQHAIVAVLVRKALAAAQRAGLPGIVLAGGVAANTALRTQLQAAAAAQGLWTCVPPKPLCTDNAAMIGAAGALRLQAGERASLAESVVSRWALEDLRPPAVAA